MNRAVQFLESQLESFSLILKKRASETEKVSLPSTVDLSEPLSGFLLVHTSAARIYLTHGMCICVIIFLYLCTSAFLYLCTSCILLLFKPCRYWWIARLLFSDWSVSAAPMVAMLGQRDSATLHISSPPSVLCLCVFLFS